MAEPDRASTRPASAPDAVSAAVPAAVSAAVPAAGSASLPVAAAVPAALRDAALALFGDRLPLAERYAEALATAGVERGLIGPREAPRIWDRHLLNCAVLGELIPSGVYVVDVGSGAGLPGIVLAVARPDLRISLVESLARRTAFLNEVVETLGLSSVDVVRARAEECVNVLPPADVVTARAVAPLDRLASWCLPLARPGGVMLAIKGSSAAAEISAHTAAVRRLGGGTPSLVQAGARWLAEPTTVVEVSRTARSRGAASGSSREGSVGGSGGALSGGSRERSPGGSGGASGGGSGRASAGGSREGSPGSSRDASSGGSGVAPSGGPWGSSAGSSGGASAGGSREGSPGGSRGDSSGGSRGAGRKARGSSGVGRASGARGAAGGARGAAGGTRGSGGGARSGDGGDHPKN